MLLIQKSDSVDLTNCDKEPIHIPGSIQSHGVLIVLSQPELKILQVSANVASIADVDNLKPEELIGRSVEALFSGDSYKQFQACLARANLKQLPMFLCEIQKNCQGEKRNLNLVAHQMGEMIILEIEPILIQGGPASLNLVYVLQNAISRIRHSRDPESFWQVAIQEIKQLSGFDRVMVYEFEEEGHGCVTAEIREGHLEPMLDLHYPASDIPAQARRLYVNNLLRTIPDIDYQPVPLIPLLNPKTGAPLDMSYTALRSVSPIHTQYLKNMGVSATMVISIVKNQALWGLIACHHYSPKYIPYDIRTVCGILGEFINLEYMVRLEEKEHQYKLKLLEMEARFIEFMANSPSFADGLMNFSPNLGDFISAEGAILYEGSVIYTDHQIRAVGNTPSEDQVHDLVDWLNQKKIDSLYCTNELPKVYPPALAYKDSASGLLAISISTMPNNYILWFRPEKIQTVNWAGDPALSKVSLKEGEVLTPRASFALWKETVKLKSLPWRSDEQMAAQELRDVIMHILLHKAQDLILRNRELERQVAEKTMALTQSNLELEQFATIASHDLQAPLRKISQFSDFLKSSSIGGLPPEHFDYIDRIQKAISKMQLLINDLLDLSRVNRKAGELSTQDLREVLHEVLHDLEPLIQETGGTVEIGETLSIDTYPLQIHQLFQNLIENALKFHRENVPPIVKVDIKPVSEDFCEITVQDNGVGFDEKYLDRIFKLFERLHGVSVYEGSGIGLGIVRKIVDRHHGEVTAKSKPGEGSTFIVRLPIHQKNSCEQNPDSQPADQPALSERQPATSSGTML